MSLPRSEAQSHVLRDRAVTVTCSTGTCATGTCICIFITFFAISTKILIVRTYELQLSLKFPRAFGTKIYVSTTGRCQIKCKGV